MLDIFSSCRPRYTETTLKADWHTFQSWHNRIIRLKSFSRRLHCAHKKSSPQRTQTTHLDDLPEELLDEIIGYLTASELEQLRTSALPCLASLSLVCCKLHRIVEPRTYDPYTKRTQTSY
jgi:hypothetical protein